MPSSATEPAVSDPASPSALKPALESAWSWHRPFDRWLDGIEAGWAIPAFLAVFVVAWMAILQLAYLSGDLHPDVVEAWSTGRTLAWGSAKHPPLTGWIARAWTAVFPVADWSFHLLAMINAAVALWSVDLIARRFVRGDKRAVVLLLLLLLPVYQFQAQRFNANSVLFALWPLAVYCFLRSFETRAIGWSVAAGVFGAFCILGKYYSAFLIVGFAVAAVCHPLRWSYFRSPAPWVSIVVGAVLLAPHVHWLVTSGISPFAYALEAHGRQTIVAAAEASAMFVPGVAATLALPLLVWGLFVRSKFARYRGDLRAMDPGLWLLALIAIATLVVPPVVTIALKSAITATWAAQGLFLVIVVAVGASTFALARIEIDRLVALLLGVTCLTLACAPIHAVYRNSHPFKEGRNYYRLAAQELTRRWRAVSTVPLATTGGQELSRALSFYGADHPAFAVPDEWKMPSQAVLRNGWATICLQDEATCLAWSKMVASVAEGAMVFDFTVQPTLWGRPGVPARISAVMVPPKSRP